MANSMINRMVRACKVESELYEEVEADKSANSQAVLVVVLVSIIAGLGTFISAIIAHANIGGIIWGLVGGIISALLGWLIWSFLTWVLGTTILKGKNTSATYGELLRTIGFANSPNVFRFFVFIPFIGPLIALAAFIWSLIAGVIAVRQALDVSTGRAIAITIVGWIVYIVIAIIIGIFVAGAGVLLNPIPS
jgi:hypothetical protein